MDGPNDFLPPLTCRTSSQKITFGDGSVDFKIKMVKMVKIVAHLIVDVAFTFCSDPHGNLHVLHVRQRSILMI